MATLKEGIVVTLYKNNVSVGTDTTDVNGAYSFADLEPGSDYSVKIGLPADNASYAHTFGSVVIDTPPGTYTTDATFGRPVTIAAGVASHATFIYNKNALV